MTVRITGTSITGTLRCGVDADVIVETTRLGIQRVAASDVEVIPGGEDEQLDREIIADARARRRA